MENKILLATKNNWQNGLLMGLILWLMIWGTYNTEIGRVFTPGFPHNAFDLLHGLRAFLPFVSFVLSAIILIRVRLSFREIFFTPLGLLLIFAVIGEISSLFSRNQMMALYFGFLYGTVVLALFAVLHSKNSLKNISGIINVNWLIAGILALGLAVFFLLQPGVVNSLTYNFLICSQRPFEGFGGVNAEANTFGMAGTRPTGFGRYAGIVAIVAFIKFLYIPNALKKKKTIWFLLFALFLFLLLFSKGRTEIIAFIAAMIFVLWIKSRFKTPWIILLGIVILVAGFVIFYNIPCSNSVGFINPLLSIFHVSQITSKNIESIISLSGRTSGVWKDAWNLFLTSPLFGRGFQSDRIYLKGQHAHNTIIHALIQAGILGTIGFVLALVLTLIILRQLFKNRNINEKERNFLIVLTGALVFFTVRGITESLAFFSADWLFVAPIIAYIQCLGEKYKTARQNNKIMNFDSNKINIIGLSETTELIEYWIKNESQKSHWIIVTGMHGAVEAHKHTDFKYILSFADLWVPDGISLVWLARLKGFDIKERVSGTDLMLEFLKISGQKGYKNFFYGDTEETLKKLSEKFPKVKADFYSPPFRELSEQEDEEIIERINQARPDVLWVALGLPKQEKWIFRNKDKLRVPVVIGVGAAFKFLAGTVKRASKWIGDWGFEWLWRLVHEPRAVWKRVFIDGPFFIWLVIKDMFENN